MGGKATQRSEREIQHGTLLAKDDTELIWGWGTPAGQLRSRRRAALIVGGAKLRPGMSVLEIGCGTGMFTEMFAKSGAHIIAVDVSADLLQKALKRNLPHDRVQFLEGRFEDCHIHGPFDAIIGSSVLHHLSIETASLRIYELLKPDGIMSFAEPNMLNPQVFVERRFRRWFQYVSPDETAFTRFQLYRILTQARFHNITICPFDWLHPATPLSMMDLVCTAEKCLECVPIIRECAGSLYIRCQRPSHR